VQKPENLNIIAITLQVFIYAWYIEPPQKCNLQFTNI